MVEFFGLDDVAEAQPEAVEEIDLVRSEIWGVGTEDFEDFVPAGHMNLEVELRLRIAEMFPSFADLAGLFFTLPFVRRAGNDGGRLQALAGAKNTVPEVVRRDYGETNGFAAFFSKAERLREELLFDAAEELIGVEFLFTGGGATQDADV